jgi:hypothetical protein
MPSADEGNRHRYPKRASQSAYPTPNWRAWTPICSENARDPAQMTGVGQCGRGYRNRSEAVFSNRRAPPSSPANRSSFNRNSRYIAEHPTQAQIAGQPRKGKYAENASSGI